MSKMTCAVWPIVLACVLMADSAATARELRVCADPNNLPFSNEARTGFENRVVELLAHELGAQVRYLWWAQRRGNIRETLKAGLCDVIPGVGSQMEAIATTRPYYRSTYVFVTRRDRHLDIEDFDDNRLRTLIIGVQMIGDDSSNTPPAHELARRGIVDNVRGYMVYGDYAKASPARAVVDDVASGVLDLAVIWGPLAGYFSRVHDGRLKVQAIATESNLLLPMTFDISMGVRKEDAGLRQELDAALTKRATQIGRILAEYGVP